MRLSCALEARSGGIRWAGAALGVCLHSWHSLLNAVNKVRVWVCALEARNGGIRWAGATLEVCLHSWHSLLIAVNKVWVWVCALEAKSGKLRWAGATLGVCMHSLLQSLLMLPTNYELVHAQLRRLGDLPLCRIRVHLYSSEQDRRWSAMWSQGSV